MLTRRQAIFAGTAWIALAACGKHSPSPLSTSAGPLPSTLQERLTRFSRLVERADWEEALTYFDDEHLAFQRHIYFSPDYNEQPPDENNATDVAKFREWYLVQVLGLAYVDNHVDELSQVQRIEYVGIEEPFGEDGPIKVLLRVDTVIGERTGWFFMHRDSGAMFGSSG